MALSTDTLALPLITVMRFVREGRISHEDWLSYAHAWQTGAARFEVRACQCAECVKNFPSPEYKPLESPG
jgi:hypothetical protein